MVLDRSECMIRHVTACDPCHVLSSPLVTMTHPMMAVTSPQLSPRSAAPLQPSFFLQVQYSTWML